jgi:hypothetical protein
MPKKRTELSDMDKRIIHLMATHSLCLSAVADALHYHCNTVRYHVDVIRRDTGKDPSQFYDLVSLLHDLGDLKAEQLVRGRWMPQIVLGQKAWECSECRTLGSPYWKRCPVCESKMEREGETNG